MSGATNTMDAHLKEMVESLSAIKGNNYARLVVSIFSQVNCMENILHTLDGPQEVKVDFGNTFGVISMQLAGCVMHYEIRVRHPEFDSYTEERRQQLGEALGEEFRKDLEMLHNKQMEFMK